MAKADTLTAQQVIERIQKNVGVPWRTTTVDTIKAGSADSPVKGIATTMVATLDLLKRASAANRNFVIVHEPTFYNATRIIADFNADDPMVQLKRGFIEKNNMVVWRFHIIAREAGRHHLGNGDGLGVG